jgi:16S rRNA (uracil1498-N3)-methyltransferase
MNLIYCPQANLGAIIVPEENEFHHLQVLRARDGEQLHVFDGAGNLYLGTIINMAKRSATIQVNDLIKNEPIPTAQLHIAIAPTKNIERTEWFIEKATEIGIQTITPIICQRSERRELRIDRLDKVILSAAKQSLHLHLPKLNNALSFKEFIKTAKDIAAKKFIAFCEEKTMHLKDSFKAGESILVLIGPEGDFSNEEIALAKGSGFEAISLGESRLRTETAGVMTSAIFNLAQSVK